MEHAGGTKSGGAASAPRPRVSAWRTHLALAGGLALCVAAFWFELRRALGGNELSWAYVFEWPLLGAFGVYMWWRVLHPAVRRSRRARASESPEFQRMRDAWEGHQRDLLGGDEGSRTHEDVGGG